MAAGDNIALPVFNFLLRGLGAFFIRRKIDQGEESGTISQSGASKKDYIYRGVLQEVNKSLSLLCDFKNKIKMNLKK